MVLSRRTFAALVAAAGMGVASVSMSNSAVASFPIVTGAGSTAVQTVIDQWRAEMAHQGYAINYQPVGSSAGRALFIYGAVDFATSEIPFQPDELFLLAQGGGKHFQYAPDVGFATSLMYNLHTPSGSRLTGLRLNADAAAKIFTGVITSWADPEIASLNPGLQIRETRIVPVIRADGSGTSAQFSLYLADQAPDVWNPFASSQGCPAPCSLWPRFSGSENATFSDGVANFIASDAVGSGAIGYLEPIYAFGRGFPVASLRNTSGGFTQPTSNNVSVALAHATLNADLTQNLGGVYRAPEPNAYPLSSYSYMILPCVASPTATPTCSLNSGGFDPAKGAVLGAWLIHVACAGQRVAAPLGFAPLPPNLVKADFDAVGRIPGAPAPPPLDPVHCPNPTVTRADQTITFGPLVDKIFGEPPFAITATASSGLPVTFSSSGMCSVAANVVVLNGVGSCTVIAAQAGNNTFNPAPNVSATFQVLSPAEFAVSVVDSIAGMNVPDPTSDRLTRSLQSFVDATGSDQQGRACGLLTEVANAVEAQSGKQISAVDSALLLADVGRLDIVSRCAD